MDVATGLAAASQAIDILKKLRDANKALSEAESKMQIAELMVLLSDAKIALADARVALSDKDAEIARLTEVQAGKLPIVRSGGFSFGIESGRVNRIPFCPTCEQTKGIQNQFSLVHEHNLLCSICNRVETRLPTPPPAPQAG